MVTAANQEQPRYILTIQNIKYLVEGLEALLMTDLDGAKRTKVIELRDELASQISSILSDYS
ncbi:MAG TPA: hypothetical protein VFA15_00990 [Nitrososphaera sp.]|nr:hypothetical protein [Nitrososphaera sp.]